MIVEPVAGGTNVRFDTVLESGGVEGIVTRLFAARLLAPIYEEELERLDRLAHEHPPLEVRTPAVA